MNMQSENSRLRVLANPNGHQVRYFAEIGPLWNVTDTRYVIGVFQRINGLIFAQ
jgi:hypothetical protein